MLAEADKGLRVFELDLPVALGAGTVLDVETDYAGRPTVVGKINGSRLTQYVRDRGEVEKTGFTAWRSFCSRLPDRLRFPVYCYYKKFEESLFPGLRGKTVELQVVEYERKRDV